MTGAFQCRYNVHVCMCYKLHNSLMKGTFSINTGYRKRTKLLFHLVTTNSLHHLIFGSSAVFTSGKINACNCHAYLNNSCILQFATHLISNHLQVGDSNAIPNYIAIQQIHTLTKLNNDTIQHNFISHPK